MKRFFLPLAFGVLLFTAEKAQAQSPETGKEEFTSKKAYTYVEQMPEFRGDLMQYLSSSLKYPESAKREKIGGKVVVRFVIDESGNVKDPKIARPVQSDLDAEALRVIAEMPAWKPGIQSGKPVEVHYTIPVVFQLKDNPEAGE